MAKSLKMFSLVLLSVFFTTTSAQNLSSLIQLNGDGTLRYIADEGGNTVPDFSWVGYRDGEVEIPDVAVVRTISPVSGDNRSHIQSAIDEVAALQLGSDGFRGALLLSSGEYSISGRINITASGVVIRGDGYGNNGTILIATAQEKHDLIRFNGPGGPSTQSASTVNITDSYVPVGARTFNVQSGHSFQVGDRVMLQKRPNQAWVELLGMHTLEDEDASTSNWTPGGYIMNYRRRVVEVNGNSITIDASVVDQIDEQYGEGRLIRFTWNNGIENVGIENIRLVSEYQSSTDEDHGWNGVVFNNTEHGWVRNVETRHFGYSSVTVNGSSSNISINRLQASGSGCKGHGRKDVFL